LLLIHCHRLKLALEFGAAQVFKAEDGREQEAVLVATGQRGVDLAFEVAGQPSSVETSVAAACPGGKVLLVGIPEDDHTSFSASMARRKGLTLKLVRRMKHTYPRAIQLVESGLVQLKPILSHEFSLTESGQAFELASRRVGHKITIKP
jgi:L-iditol 2-dehydrogenase